MDTAYLCEQCGTEFTPGAAPPPSCPICEDERQYVHPQGQRWTTLSALHARLQARIEVDHGVVGIGSTPAFAIDQRALVVPGARGHVLWDCIALLNDEITRSIGALGGLDAIAISHPHYYSTMVSWAQAFDVPIYLHEDDRQWVMRPDDRIIHWSGEMRAIDASLTLIRCGGHFEGGTVLHRREDGGSLFTGDILQVTADRQHVSVMRSFPNYIPLGPSAVAKIRAALAPFAYQRVYGAFHGKVIAADGKAAVERSLARYLDWISR